MRKLNMRMTINALRRIRLKIKKNLARIIEEL